MKFWLKTTFGLLAIGGLATIYTVNQTHVKNTEEEQSSEKRALHFQIRDVLEIVLRDNAHGEFVFSRKSADEPWKMQKPKAVEADQDVIDGLLVLATKTLVERKLEENKETPDKEEEKQKEMGLDRPRSSFSITLKNGEKKSLSFGAPLPFSLYQGKQDSAPFVYAISSEQPSRSLVTTSDLAIALKNKDFFAFRRKKTSHFSFAQVARFVVATPNHEIVVAHEQNRWMLEKPELFLANEAQVKSFLGLYQGLTASKIYEAEEITDSLKSAFHLDFPSATISFFDNSQRLLQKYDIGLTVDGVYMTLQDGGVAQFDLSTWPDLVPEEKYFRNNQLTLGIDMENVVAIQLSKNRFYMKGGGNWYFSKSFDKEIGEHQSPDYDALHFFTNLRNISASDVVLHPSSSDLTAFGLRHPLKTFSLMFAENLNKAPILFSVGHRVPDDEKNAYVRRSDTGAVYLLKAALLSDLAKLDEKSQETKIKRRPTP